MRVLFIIGAFLLFFTPLKSQNKFVFDRQSGRAISDVVVKDQESGHFVLSDKSGHIQPFDHNTTIVLYKLGYHALTVSSNNYFKQDTFFLDQKHLELSEIEITPGIKKTAIKNDKYKIEDFLVLSEGRFLLAVTYLGRKGFELMLAGSNTKIYQKKYFNDEEFADLLKDCVGNFQTVSDKHSYQVVLTSDTSFACLEPYSIKQYNDYLKPCITSLDSNYVFIKEGPSVKIKTGRLDAETGPQHLAYYSVKNKKWNKIISCGFNSDIKEMVNSESTDHLMLKTAREGLLTAKQLQNLYFSEFAQEAQRVFFYKSIGKLYAPLFNSNDSLLLFDFQNMCLKYYNINGEMNKINYMNDPGFGMYHQYSIIKDEKRNDYYVLFQEGNTRYLGTFDLSSGKVSTKIKLLCAFPKKVKISNGIAYFIEKSMRWDENAMVNYQYLR